MREYQIQKVHLHRTVMNQITLPDIPILHEIRYQRSNLKITGGNSICHSENFLVTVLNYKLSYSL